MKSKVSICVPTFNRKDYLKHALHSVYAQTYKEYEVIVVDDGSTDGTEEMVKSTGYPLRYYWQENRGEVATRSRLIEFAQGQFITFLDSDDLLMPDTVERMMKVMEAESGEVIVYGPYLRIDQNGNTYGRCKRKLYSGHITRYLFQNIFIHSCGSMFPKKALEKAGGFDELLSVSADYDLWLRLSLKYRFIVLPEPTFKRRRHAGNLSRLSTENRITELQVLKRFYYEKGGADVIPESIARRRLSKEEYRVAKSTLKENKLSTATNYFRASFHRYPNPKALLMWAFSNLKQKLPGVSR